MSMLNPQQKEIINSLKGKTTDEQYEIISQEFNKAGITKEQLMTMKKYI